MTDKIRIEINGRINTYEIWSSAVHAMTEVYPHDDVDYTFCTDFK